MIPLSNNTAQIVQIFVLCISAVDDKMDKNDERSCYMDYSAANASLWNVVIQLGFIAGAILVAGLLRNNIKLVRKSMMPVAVITRAAMTAVRPDGILFMMNDTKARTKMLSAMMISGVMAFSFVLQII